MSKSTQPKEKSQSKTDAINYMQWCRAVRKLMKRHMEYDFKEELRDWLKDDNNGKRMFNEGATPLECYGEWFREFFV